MSNLVFDIQAWVNGFQFEHPGFKVSGFELVNFSPVADMAQYGFRVGGFSQSAVRGLKQATDKRFIDTKLAVQCFAPTLGKLCNRFIGFCFPGYQG